MSARDEAAGGVELRMDAYCYAFTPTGVEAVDRILSAVACAGKSFHSTEDWSDESAGRPTPVEKIQDAANEAAAAFSARSPSPRDQASSAMLGALEEIVRIDEEESVIGGLHDTIEFDCTTKSADLIRALLAVHASIKLARSAGIEPLALPVEGKVMT